MTTEALKELINGKFAESRASWRAANKYYYRDMLRFFRYAVPEGVRVLELGFDDGWLLHALKPSRGVYLGGSRVLNAQGKQRYPELEFVEDYFTSSIPLAEKFDYIILNNLVGSIEDVQDFFGRLHQVAGPHSRIIVNYYNYLWEPVIKMGEFLHLKQRQPIQNWLSPNDIGLLLELAGFEVLRKGQRLIIPKYFPLLAEFFNLFLAKFPLFDRLGFWNYVMARPHWHSQRGSEFSVSVVVPARNEKGNIEELIARVPEMGKGTELVFVENDSTDGTWEEIVRVAEKYHGAKQVSFTRQSGGGKVGAVTAGFEMAKGEILMILDADMTVAPEDLPRFYNVLASGQAEYTHGSRLVYPMRKEAMRILNLFGNKVFSMIFSWLLKRRIKDTLCGTKVLFAKDYVRLAAQRGDFGHLERWGDFDLIFGAHKLGLKMVEIPIHYYERSYGQSNMKAFKHGWQLLRMCVLAFRRLE
ncbi:MAG: glycosyltransferase [bacterium]|nr:glycosyltransferase [bacterium]